MALERIITVSDACKIGIWKLDESLDDLLKLIHLDEKDMQTMMQFKLDKRKAEWICARIVLKHLLNCYPTIEYDQNGKPSLSNDPRHISISHTHGYVAVSCSNRNTAIDIERCTSRVDNVHERFVHADEAQYIVNGKQTEYRTLIWTIKEALYKYYNVYAVVFKDHFRVLPFVLEEKGAVDTWFKWDAYNEKVSLSYEHTDNYMLAYTTNHSNK